MHHKPVQPPPADRRGRFFPSLPRPLARLLVGVLVTAFWLGLWQLLAWRMAQPLLLPGPVTVLRRLRTLAATALFWQAVLTSLGRIVAGILTGLAAGSLLAVLTHFIPPLYTLFYPFITVIRSTPVASFVILLYIWIGQDTLPIFISVLLVLPVVWANLHEALGGVDADLLEMAHVFRLSPWRRLCRIYLPSLIPALAASCRSSVGLAWKAGIAAEVLVVPALSIGRYLFESKLYLETTDLFAWTIPVTLLSLLLERLMLRLMALAERRHPHPAPTDRKEGSSCDTQIT